MLVRTDLSRRVIGDVYCILESALRTDDPLTDTILERILAKRGKCVRPLFMALLADLTGSSWERCRYAAAVVEAIHLASLLHDDVVDGSDLRRGAETVNAAHSDKISVLYGDHIFITALRMARELDAPEAVAVIFDAVAHMVRGEIGDTLDTGFQDEDAYLSMIGDKTASLFAAAGELVVILGEGTDENRRQARELGESVGLLFQIVDDVLDYDGDRTVMGKPAGVDALAGHMTLPLIHAVRGMSGEERRGLFAGKGHAAGKITAFVRDRGGIEYARNRAREYADRARETARGMAGHDAAEQFGELVDMLLGRHL